nr:hypothetical protein [Tanacetum cinerariifolium]
MFALGILSLPKVDGSNKGNGNDVVGSGIDALVQESIIGGGGGGSRVNIGNGITNSGNGYDVGETRDGGGVVNALLPILTTQITNELGQNGAGGNGDQPSTIHTWLEWFGKQKPGSFSSATTLKCEREYHTICQREDELTGEFMKRFLRLAGFIRKKAGPPEKGGSNNKRNHDGDRIQPAARNNNQKGYDQRRSDGRVMIGRIKIRRISVRGEMM